MHLSSLFAFLDMPPYMIAVFVPIAALIFAGAVVISAMYFRQRRRELWHETARLALEKGQPLPPLDAEDAREAEQVSVKKSSGPGHSDVRSGLILVGVGIGLWLMFNSLAPDVRMIGAIPFMIGVAQLLYAALLAFFGRKTPPPAP